MKGELGFFKQAALKLISLLSIVIGINCTSNTPRYEPEFLGYYLYTQNSQTPMRDLQSIVPTPSNPKIDDPTLYKFKQYYKSVKDDLSNFLNEIGFTSLLDKLRGQLSYSKEQKEEVLVLDVTPIAYGHLANDLSTLVEAKQIEIVDSDQERAEVYKLPNRLSILCARDEKDEFWDRCRLVGIESIAISSNPLLPHSEKHYFALRGFILDRKSHIKDATNHQIVIVWKSPEGWRYYNKGEPAKLSNKEASDLASRATVFFYEKK